MPDHRNNDGIGNNPATMFVAATLVISLLGACTTRPDYGPRAPGAIVGFDEVRLAPDRYRVDFSGTTTGSRQEVQNYLAQRAAELTLQSGFTHFTVGRHATEIARRRQVGFISDAYLHGPDYFNRARRWSKIPLAEEEIETRYIAWAEVAMLSAEQARGNAVALSAVDVIRRLQPSPPVHIASAAP